MIDQFDGMTMEDLVVGSKLNTEVDTKAEGTGRATELIGELVSVALVLGEDLDINFLDAHVLVTLDDDDDFGDEGDDDFGDEGDDLGAKDNE